MKYKFLTGWLLAAGLMAQAQKVSLPKVFADAEQQTEVMLKEIPAAKSGKADLVSPRAIENDQLKLVPSKDWTSGFFPGELWFLYGYTGKKDWRIAAEKFTSNIEVEKTNAGTHDMGFKIYCS